MCFDNSKNENKFKKRPKSEAVTIKTHSTCLQDKYIKNFTIEV